MFILEGLRFTTRDYYRDDALALSALKLAQRGPLLVVGLAGIGKSWFLRRLAALATAGESRHFRDDGAPFSRAANPGVWSAVEAYDVRADGPRAVAEVLEHRLKQPDPRRLLLIDEAALLLAPARSPSDAGAPEALAQRALVEAISRYPAPLVLAASPRILSIAALEPCRSLLLPPLSLPERRALLLQTEDRLSGLDVKRATLGLHAAFGGHPRVLGHAGTLLRGAPAAVTLDALIDGVSEWLAGYGAAIAESLTAIEQEALLAATWGESIPERLRGAALSLTLHGALLRQSDGWTLENQVLARQLRHELR